MAKAKKYKLITPNEEVIKTFNALWTKDDESKITKMKLFEGAEEVDISDWPLLKELENNKKKDEKIRGLKETDFPEFLKEINKVYSTRLSLKKGYNWDDEDWCKEKVEKMCKEEKNGGENGSGIAEFINVCKNKTGRNEYSFATKVFSFMCPDSFPILDSISGSLLYQYYTDLFDKPNKKSAWSNYKQYTKDYEAIMNKLGISSMKEFDIFLWTYGSLISQYWENSGIIKFESISYKAPK